MYCGKRSASAGVGLLLVTVACIGGDVNAATSSSDDASLEDLGDNLLNDATLRDLIKAAENASPLRSSSDSRPSLLPEIDDLRRMLDPSRHIQPEGEDLGQQSQSPLTRISNQMARAGDLIASQDTSGEARLAQEEVIAELDKLINQLNKQCQNCSGGQCNKPGNQQTQSTTPKPGGQSSPSAGNQAAVQQSRVSSGGGGEAQPGEVVDRDVVKQLWGQLPERLRQQQLQSTADEFLPKYKAELEMYFRRLAEERIADEAQP